MTAKFSEPTFEQFEVKQFVAAFVSRGYVRFIHIRPDRDSRRNWVCDECLKMIRPSNQKDHARNHH